MSGISNAVYDRYLAIKTIQIMLLQLAKPEIRNGGGGGRGARRHIGCSRGKRLDEQKTSRQAPAL